MLKSANRAAASSQTCSQTARNMGGHRFRQAVHDVACLNQNGAVGVGRATDFWVFSSESVRKPSARRGGRAQVTALKENLEGSRGSAASGAGRSTAPHFLRGRGENGASANHLRGRNRPRLRTPYGDRCLSRRPYPRGDRMQEQWPAGDFLVANAQRWQY